ncbi:secretion protein HylD [Brevundimonas sp. LM2]|uniref:HlyD family type I secretion periplasmic adaptor subunit n=1 Tax=Brevundimonas sp. LM2 TaxID=1938605 RepID=UPI000983D1DE|nr:HlyD family type I secretion periplasmic adaptor subunit [Brevundimonas sp. LM2]AQR61205.1 secretion protein HylD [Brevundimonas sp. LM2]
MTTRADALGSRARPVITGSPRTELMAGAILASVFFVGFLGWAALAPLDSGAFAPGHVSVSGNRQAVQHREGGVIANLHVSEGDQVQQGQVLIDLASGDIIAAERGLSGQVYALLAQRSRLIAERDRLPMVAEPAEFAPLAGDDRALADEALRLQRLQFSARGAGRSTETGVLRQRIGQLQEQVGGFTRQIAANVEQQRLIGEELDGLRDLARQGYAPQNRVRALERTAAALEGEQGSLRAQVAGTREQIGQTRLQMLGVTTEMNEDVSDQLRQIEVQLNDLRPKLTALRDELGRSQIRSPATGQVVGLTVFTPGGVIQPGQTLMEVVPDDAAQVIVANVNPSDIDNVKLGLVTEVKFPGLLNGSAPILRGRVTRLSADSFTDETTGQSHYRAEVVVPKPEMAALGPAAARIRSGMPAEVVIVLQKRTALAYLLEPLTRTLWRSGREQ